MTQPLFNSHEQYAAELAARRVLFPTQANAMRVAIVREDWDKAVEYATHVPNIGQCDESIASFSTRTTNQQRKDKQRDDVGDDEGQQT